MTFVLRIVSYNLLHSKAVGELAGLVADDHRLDALCLQEVHPHALAERLGHLTLVAHTPRNRLALAVYVDTSRFEVLATGSFELKRSLHDSVFQRTPERLAAAHIRELRTGRDLVIASFHAAPLSARNSLRRKQIKRAHEYLAELGRGAPVIMVGDYNYPLFKDRLGERLERAGFDLVLSDKRTYSAYKLVRGHFDFVTTRDMKVESVETLRRGRSDHLPILVTASHVI